MARKKLRFAIFGNVYQAKKSASIQKILACLDEYGDEVLIDKEFYDFLVKSQLIDVKADKVFTGNDFDADFVISMGGDGTFLKAASRVAEKGIPIVGINMGRLGFLADVSPNEIESCLKAIHNNEFILDRRKLIQVDTEGGSLEGSKYALNDVAVLKRDSASMISIKVAVNGQYLITYQADGIVLSTPTGSTAYSLSNGGPIIVPGTNVFSITAVAPHSLNIRPIVFSDDSTITLDVESRSHHFLVGLDGRSEKCKEGTRLTIRKAPYYIYIVKRTSANYFQTLREKMMWGIDARQ